MQDIFQDKSMCDWRSVPTSVTRVNRQWDIAYAQNLDTAAAGDSSTAGERRIIAEPLRLVHNVGVRAA